MDVATMTAVDMIAAISDLQQRVWGVSPVLTRATVDIDGESVEVLRCPTCGGDVESDGDLYAVDVSERWSIAAPDLAHDDMDISSGDEDYDRTLYYLHDAGKMPHPVVPPDGWSETWT